MQNISDVELLRYLKVASAARQKRLVGPVLDMTMGHPGLLAYLGELLRDPAMFGADAVSLLIEVQHTPAPETANFGTIAVTPGHEQYANLDTSGVLGLVGQTFGELIDAFVIELIDGDLTWRSSSGSAVSVVSTELRLPTGIEDRLVIVTSYERKLSDTHAVLLANLFVDFGLASRLIRTERIIGALPFGVFGDLLSSVHYGFQGLLRHLGEDDFERQLQEHAETASRVYHFQTIIQLMRLLAMRGRKGVVLMHQPVPPSFTTESQLNLVEMIQAISADLSKGAKLALSIDPGVMRIEPFERGPLAEEGLLWLRWYDDFYSSLFLAALQNARQYGVANEGVVSVRIGIGHVSGNDSIILSNEAERRHEPKIPLMKAQEEGWWEWYPAGGGGLDFITNLVRTAEAGEVFWRTTDVPDAPDRMRFWLALNLHGFAHRPEV